MGETVGVAPIHRVQTFSSFFRFPMIFLCGADVLHGTVHGGHMMPFALELAALAAFCFGLFALSLWNIQKRWIA